MNLLEFALAIELALVYSPKPWCRWTQPLHFQSKKPYINRLIVLD